jgi:hypothetical protein
MKSLNDLDLGLENENTPEIQRPTSANHLFQNDKIKNSTEFSDLIEDISIQETNSKKSSILYNSLNEQQLTQQRRKFESKFSPSNKLYGKFKTKNLNKKTKASNLLSENSRLYNSHLSYANTINKKLGNIGELKNIKGEIEIENKKNGTVVIKPQFFSNFQIVNIDNMIPILRSNNTNVVVSGDTNNSNTTNNAVKNDQTKGTSNDQEEEDEDKDGPTMGNKVVKRRNQRIGSPKKLTKTQVKGSIQKHKLKNQALG